jgi:hypothetical protein
MESYRNCFKTVDYHVVRDRLCLNHYNAIVTLGSINGLLTEPVEFS